MDFRTTFFIEPSGRKITYHDPVMLIGSCFTSSIGRKFETGHIPVMINPSGTVFNPVSVINTLDTVTGEKEYKAEDLDFHEGTWISFDHYTDFSSGDMPEVLDKINKRAVEARKFIAGAKFLFITFGTARVYRLKQSGRIVSNCHKMPASLFSNELLTVNEIVNIWNDQLKRLKKLFPELEIIFTISPVRHMKDGAHGNQVSKSVLFLAVEELLKNPAGSGYFPAYELLMDDLRDYRFYDGDMLHPSQQAVDYIWDAFSHCYFDDETHRIYNEVSRITRAYSHRIKNRREDHIKRFAGKILEQIDAVNDSHPEIELSIERSYFLGLFNS